MMNYIKTVVEADDFHRILFCGTACNKNRMKGLLAVRPECRFYLRARNSFSPFSLSLSLSIPRSGDRMNKGVKRIVLSVGWRAAKLEKG